MAEKRGREDPRKEKTVFCLEEEEAIGRGRIKRDVKKGNWTKEDP